MLLNGLNFNEITEKEAEQFLKVWNEKISKLQKPHIKKGFFYKLFNSREELFDAEYYLAYALIAYSLLFPFSDEWKTMKEYDKQMKDFGKQANNVFKNILI